MLPWSKKVKNIRKIRGYKQQSLAHELGVSQSTISHWERGAEIPSLAMQNKIDDLLDSNTQIQNLERLKKAVRNSQNLVLVSNKLIRFDISNFLAKWLNLDINKLINQNLLGDFDNCHDKVVDELFKSKFFQGKIASAEAVIRFYKNKSFFAHLYLVPIVIYNKEISALTTVTPIDEEEYNNCIQHWGGNCKFYPI